MNIKYHPILFKSEMVRAIMEDVKNQTRRIPTPRNCLYDGRGVKQWPHRFDWNDAQVELFKRKGSDKIERCIKVRDVYDIPHCIEPRVKPGDILLVKETWAVGKGYDADGELWALKPSELPTPEQTKIKIWYKADRKQKNEDNRGNWRPSIFMPLWMVRNRLLVKDVRVELLKSITREEAIAEGTHCWICGGPVDGSSEEDCACFHTTREAIPSFEVLWNSINEKRGWGWETNRPVVVYEFERMK